MTITTRVTINWPYKDMVVGQMVEFEPDMAKLAQNRVHAYTGNMRVDKKFSTKTVREGEKKGCLQVTRIQ